MRDETYDYGLEPGESFEPVDADDDRFDLAQPHILTALGPIDPDDLGVTVCLSPAIGEGATWSRNPAQTVAALEDAFNAGLRALVIIDPVDDERERSDLAWIAGRSPVHLVIASAALEVDTFAQSATVPGLVTINAAHMPSTPDRARHGGLPMAIASSPDQVVIVGSSAELRDSVVAAFMSGRSTEAEANPDIFVALKVQASGEVPASPSDIARPGQLLLAFDANPSAWAELMERAPISLMERGFDAPTVRRILIDNPAKALKIRP